MCLVLACVAALVAPVAGSRSPKLYAGTLRMAVSGGAAQAQQFCPADFQTACDGATFNVVVRDNGVFSVNGGSSAFAGA